jgi:protein disulfide-isomerase
MKKLVIVFLIFLMIMPFMLFAKQKKQTVITGTWLTDFDQAKTIAKAHKIPILINFTGSDWCIWCKRLSSEVFEQKAFNDYAKKNLVLLKIDFPRENKQTEAEKRKNRQLMEQFKIEGYPTIILTDATGKEINRTGYQAGGPVKYVNHLKELLSNPAQ